MMMRSRTPVAAVALALGLQVACGGDPTSPSPTPAQSTFISYSSEPGDFVGGGIAARLTLTTATFTPFVNDHFHQGIRQQISLTIRPLNPPNSSWSLRLLSAVGQRLTVGRYENAETVPSSADRPGLDFGAGRGCNEATGRFEIREVVYGSNQPLDRLRVTFEQRCVGSMAGLRGEAVILADPWR